MTDVRAAITEQARALGFDAVGFAPAEIDKRAGERLALYTNKGLHGDMGWLAGRWDERRQPNGLWDAAKSVVVLGQNYGPAGDPLALLERADCGNVSVYARGRDYHDVVKKRLKKLGRWIAESYGCEVKVFVDTAPVMEKPLAARAGLGWQGKHTNLVSRDYGSWLFLGSVFTTLELPADRPHDDHCGGCRRCLDVCPTDAFPQPYLLDARRCISYLTIEHKGHIAREFRTAIGNRIYGCDDCLAVCPWNKFAQRAAEARLHPRADLVAPQVADFLQLDDAGFRDLFSGSPVKRLGRDRFVRNVLIAAGNSGNAGLTGQIEALLGDSSPLVRAMAVWALGELLPAHACRELERIHRPRESDADVLAEWRAIADRAKLDNRKAADMKTIYEHGFGTLETWPVPTDEESLRALLTDAFQNYWRDIAFGPLIQGAAWEIALQEPPRKIAMLDGYMTVDFGTWHFHLCIGEHAGTEAQPTDADLAAHRRTGRAEFFRRVNDDGTPDVWGFRLFNGHGEQQITVLLPNPFLSRDMKFLKEPDWSRLAAWDALRKTHLGLDPDPKDRTGERLIHA